MWSTRFLERRFAGLFNRWIDAAAHAGDEEMRQTAWDALYAPTTRQQRAAMKVVGDITMRTAESDSERKEAGDLLQMLRDE